MRTQPLLKMTLQRFRPSNWGALPLFMGLLLLVRWVLGGPVIPWNWHFALGGGLHLLGFFALAPAPWLWTGDDRHRPGKLRGAVQAVPWNLLWLFGFGTVYSIIGGPEPPRLAEVIRHLALDATLPSPALRIVFQLPFACLAGWFIAEMEARELDRAAVEAARKELETHARESQAQALRAQMDPHLLYNALGALSELVREAPTQAEEALLDFSDFYRRLTLLWDLPFITLAEERQLLEQYLAIEALRLGPRLRVEWRWPEELGDVRLPPLLLLPLVENAIKHGLAPDLLGGALSLEARRGEDGALQLTVKNQGRPLGQERAGTGLRNLRARLALLGDGHSRLELRSEGGWTLAELCLAPDALGEAP